MICLKFMDGVLGSGALLCSQQMEAGKNVQCCHANMRCSVQLYFTHRLLTGSFWTSLIKQMIRHPEGCFSAIWRSFFPPCQCLKTLSEQSAECFWFFDRLSAFADVSSSVVQTTGWQVLQQCFHCSSHENLNSPIIIFGLQKANQIALWTNEGCFLLGLKSGLKSILLILFLLFGSYGPFFIK